MNLLEDAWIPVRAEAGTGDFRLLTYRDVLCEPGTWQVSLPRDDLELACVQLLACMTQVMFPPEDDRALRKRLVEPLSRKAFDSGVAPCVEWFDLDHPTQPFMQSRGVEATDDTPIQKLLVGLPEGNNHAFFNEVGEVRNLSGPVAAIALFNQASNSPSFGGGFKGSLRGGAPITTLVASKNSSLRETIWLNVLTLPRIQERLPRWTLDYKRDQPTWVKPIRVGQTIRWNEIGLIRGLFWQPARVELVCARLATPCDVLGGASGPVYSDFRKEKFSFTVERTWPHPHGAMVASTESGSLELKFASFTTAAPAWTLLSEFVVPRDINAPDAKEGCVPAGPVTQAGEICEGGLYLVVGGYRTKKALVTERRHELMSLAQGWNDDKGRLKQLVDTGKEARKALYSKLYVVAKGKKGKGKRKELQGIGAPIHEIAERLYYGRTESLIHEVFSNVLTFKEWKVARADFADQLAGRCDAIFKELTDPYAMKPELIPVIAWARRGLNAELAKLTEGT